MLRMKISFQRGMNVCGPWWTTSVVEVDEIPLGLPEPENLPNYFAFNRAMRELTSNAILGEYNQLILIRMRLYKDDHFWLTASRDEIERAIKDAISLNIGGDVEWDIKF